MCNAKTSKQNLSAMTECIPFLLVPNMEKSIHWYKNIGFECVATNLDWEPDCALNWARLEWEGAAFMLGIDERIVTTGTKDASLWFNVGSIDPIIEILKKNEIKFELEPATFYGRKVVSFKDISGFVLAFSCPID